MTHTDVAPTTTFRIQRGDYSTIGNSIPRIHQHADAEGIFYKHCVEHGVLWSRPIEATPIPKGLEILVLPDHSREYLPSADEAFDYALGQLVTDTQPETFLREIELGNVGVETTPYGSNSHLVSVRLYKITPRA